MVRYTGAAVEALWGDVAYGCDTDLDTLQQLMATGLPFMVLGPPKDSISVWFPCGCRISAWEGWFDEHLSHWCFDHDPEGGVEEELKELYLRDIAKEAAARQKSTLEVLLEKYQKGEEK